MRRSLLLVFLLVGCTAPISTANTALTTTTTLAPTTTSTTTSTTLATTTTSTPTTTTLVPVDGLMSVDRRLVELTAITGQISPKSVVHSGEGLFFAQNMMYRHTITVYDRDHQLVATIPDLVDPAAYGFDEYGVELLGSPVEVAFSSDGTKAYVSNYKMYGGGLSTAAGDACGPADWPDSFVYRIDTATFQIDQLIRVGPVPKFLAVTHDDTTLVVANWCGFDVSIVDLATGVERARIAVGRHPRGVATIGNTAYVAIMGSTQVAKIDLSSLEVSYLENVGRNPRHLVISPDGRHLYVTLNGEGRLVKLDLLTEKVVGSVATGRSPRSMAISDDGTALYVVNYNSDTVSKVSTAQMVEVEEHPTDHDPIGVTYDPATRQVWVANYSGTIQVFADTAP